MEIKILKEKFETIRRLMECVEDFDGSAIVLTNDKPNQSFERHYPDKTGDKNDE